jgi:hypothetical protein
VPSVESRTRAARMALTGAVALGAAGLLAGCATTMQEASRLQLNSARIRASQVSTRVTSTSTSPQVRVTGLDVVTEGKRAAFVVRLRNDGRRTLSDLPISVGYRLASGNATYLNAGDDLDYFQAHLPVIAAGRQLTWVFSASAAEPRGARPFALVGATPAATADPTASLPVVTARAGSARGEDVRVELDNASSVPQYQLQVYAVAVRDGGYVAAGNTTVEHLGTSSSRTIELPLLGSLSRATVEVEALPTIFR